MEYERNYIVNTVDGNILESTTQLIELASLQALVVEPMCYLRWTIMLKSSKNLSGNV